MTQYKIARDIKATVLLCASITDEIRCKNKLTQKLLVLKNIELKNYLHHCF